MMGTALYTLNVPIAKTSGAFLFLTREEAELPEETNCIRCGRCVEHCPMGLMPLELNSDAVAGDFEAFARNNGHVCIECGACSYVCPAGRYLTQSLSMGRKHG